MWEKIYHGQNFRGEKRKYIEPTSASWGKEENIGKEKLPEKKFYAWGRVLLFGGKLFSIVLVQICMLAIHSCEMVATFFTSSGKTGVVMTQWKLLLGYKLGLRMYWLYIIYTDISLLDGWIDGNFGECVRWWGCDQMCSIWKTGM